jgi:hypothetical protein
MRGCTRVRNCSGRHWKRCVLRHSTRFACVSSQRAMRTIITNPALYPFERDASGTSDFSHPNPAFFTHLEQRISDLRALGIEADLILFHPYDRWGYATMPAEADDRYLRYVLARMSAYRNVWWSLANEWDLMKAKSVQDFNRFFHIVEQHDPVEHLRSVHYSRVMYDYGQPWVTHASLQTSDFQSAPEWLKSWRKPIVFDEIMYEGNLSARWGKSLRRGDDTALLAWCDRGLLRDAR